MKKIQRTLIGCTATCVCFFVAMLAGSFHNMRTNSIAAATPATEKNLNDLTDVSLTPVPDFSVERPSVTPTIPVAESISDTPTPSPVVPTESPTPTVSPTPTLSPTPTVTPTPTVSPTPTLSPTPTVSPTPAPVAYVPDFSMAAVTKNLNIRSGPGTDKKIIGKLPADCYAHILSIENGWAKISTGTIKEGYVSADYIFSPEEVMSICDREQLISASVTASALNVRSGPGTWYESIKKVKKGQSFQVLLSQSYEGWFAIQVNSSTVGYVSENYVTLSYNMDTGMTLKEIEEKERQEAIAAAMARAQIFSVPASTRPPVTMTEDELYLFATVIYTESGDQGYDGMLAVANVILNRMECGEWGTTVEEVLFAPGQFAGARKELIDRAQARGIPDSCFKVAKDALSGKNNIGDFLFFRTTSSAMRASDYLYYTKFYIIKDHVFYWKNW